MTFGVAAVLGMLAGSAAYALAARSFRWEGFGSVEDVANHMVGGVLMGFGGVTALGCTIGQGITGVSTLAAGSFLGAGVTTAPKRSLSSPDDTMVKPPPDNVARSSGVIFFATSCARRRVRTASSRPRVGLSG